MSAEMLLAALDLIPDWAVFPCKEHGADAKRPYTKRGHHDASTDPAQVGQWWSRWPHAMIGAPVPAGVAVLDIDPRNGGSLDALQAVTGPLPPTLTVWSGRGDGGRHLYFQVPAELKLTSTRLPSGVDLKRNGYCILPPSIHPATGLPYRWEGAESVSLPERALRALIHAPAPRRPPTGTLSPGRGSGLVRTVAEATNGQRNSALNWAAYHAAKDGILDLIEPALIEAAQAAGLAEREIANTIKSARGAAK